jgi:hypothetical protein
MSISNHSLSRTRIAFALVVSSLCLCLFALLGCTTSTGQVDNTTQIDQDAPDAITVQQAAADAATAILAGSTTYDFSLITGADVVADPATKEIRIMLTTRGADVKSGCAVGDDAARVMDGLVFPDETMISDGSLGTLYDTWSLSIAVEDELDATLDLDAMRPAGADAQITWQ